MKLSDAQIALVASQAGFRGSDLPIAVAVALAESGGDSNAINTANSDGSTDHGLFQINSVHADLLSKGSWANPNDNARMAYAVWHGSGWQAWSTYNNGKYLLFMGRGRAAASRLENSGTIPPVAGAVSKPKSAPKIIPPYDPPIGPVVHKYGDFPKSPINPVARTKILKFISDVKKAADKAGSINNAHIPTSALDPKQNDTKLAMSYGLAFGVWSNLPDVIQLPGEKAISDATSIVTSLANLIKFIANPDNWIRVGYFLFGGLLILIAAYKVSGAQIPSAAKAAVAL